MSRTRDDLAALDDAYERYAAGLYDYGRWLSGDPDTAENCVHAALIAAAGRPGVLTDPKRLRGWLYAAARNECLRGRGADTEPPPSSGPGRLAEVRDTAATLGRHGQEVAELAFRHRLVPPEIAVVLGHPARAVKKTVMGAYTVLAAEYGPDAPRAFAGAPAALPEPLYGRVVASAGIADRRMYFAERAGPYSAAGYPLPVDRPTSRRRPFLAAGAVAAAVIAVLVLVVASVLSTDQRPRPVLRPVVEPSLDVAEQEPVPELSRRPSPSPTASPSPTPSPSVRRSASPSPRRSSTPSPGPQAAPPPVPTVKTQLRAIGGCNNGTWSMRIAVTASGATARSAEVIWWVVAGGGGTRTVAAGATGANTFEATITGLPDSQAIQYRGAVTSTAGVRGQSGVSSFAFSCRRR